MLVECVTDLDRQLTDPLHDRLQCANHREHDLAVRLYLELAGASFSPSTQLAQELAGWFAAWVTVLDQGVRRPAQLACYMQ